MKNRYAQFADDMMQIMGKMQHSTTSNLAYIDEMVERGEITEDFGDELKKEQRMLQKKGTVEV